MLAYFRDDASQLQTCVSLVSFKNGMFFEIYVSSDSFFFER